MNDLLTPLTAPDCDLKDFAFMPLDVARLRDSDLAALESPEACWAAVLLWCASWHQIPAASLPDDDRVLANLAGFGRVVKEWARVKDGALRGWLKCADGRLYHPVIAEKANEAFRRKLEQSWRTECSRIKKHNQRHDENNQLPYPTLDQYLSLRTCAICPSGQNNDVPEDIAESPGNVSRETASNRQGEGQGQGNNISTSQTGAREGFAMHPGWIPSDHISDMARQAGVEITPAVQQEFIAYWLSQPDRRRTQAEWDKALLQSAQHAKLTQQSVQKKPNQRKTWGIHDERAQTIAALTGAGIAPYSGKRQGREPITVDG